MGNSIKGESDVLVVGAGPAGAAAAAALARAGVQVALIDRARFPRDKTCGDAVSGRAMQILDGLGAGRAVRAGAIAEINRGLLRFPDGSLIARTYREPGFIVPRLVLDEAIRQNAVEAGAKMIEGVSVRALTLRDGRVCGVTAEGFEWSARIVIAADGYGSFTWSHVGASLKHTRGLAVSSTAYFRGIRFPDQRSDADHYFEAELPCGYGWVFPEVNGLSNAGVYIRHDSYGTQLRATQHTLQDLMSGFIARHPERFEGAERVGALRTWSLPLAPAQFAASAPGLLLVGDAGGFVDPLTGEGIWQGLHTATTAAQIAREALTRGGLTAADCARYEHICDTSVRRPSRAKLMAQEGLRHFVGAKLYRAAPLRAALRFAYSAGVFEMTKA